MWNSNKNKQPEFDGHCCAAPLMASKTVDRHPSPQLQINNGVFRQEKQGRSDSLDSTTTTTTTATTAATVKPHTGAGDPRWEAINGQDHPLGLSNFRVLKRLGYGDIGSVYLVELRGSDGAHFAMKVMDKASLVSRNKVLQADTERDSVVEFAESVKKLRDRVHESARSSSASMVDEASSERTRRRRHRVRKNANKSLEVEDPDVIMTLASNPSMTRVTRIDG